MRGGRGREAPGSGGGGGWASGRGRERGTRRCTGGGGILGIEGQGSNGEGKTNKKYNKGVGVYFRCCGIGTYRVMAKALGGDGVG